MIIPTAAMHGQMGPGGGWNFGSPPVTYTRRQSSVLDVIPDPTIEEVGHLLLTAGIGLAVGNPVVSVGVGLIHWNYHIVGPLASDVYAELTGSTGGGGPGELPNLHQPPPSIEEIGEILSNPSIAGEVPSSPRPSTTLIGGQYQKAKKRCPRWFRFSNRGSKKIQCKLTRGHRGKHRF